MKLNKNEYYIVINKDGRVLAGVRNKYVSRSRMYVREFDYKELSEIDGNSKFYLHMYKRLNQAVGNKEQTNECRGSGWVVALFNVDTKEIKTLTCWKCGKQMPSVASGLSACENCPDIYDEEDMRNDAKM